MADQAARAEPATAGADGLFDSWGVMRAKGKRNLVVSRTSVKREGTKGEDQGCGQAGQPDAGELGEPVFLGRNAGAVPAHEIDLRG
jgi:hypothetical protein